MPIQKITMLAADQNTPLSDGTIYPDSTKMFFRFEFDDALPTHQIQYKAYYKRPIQKDYKPIKLSTQSMALTKGTDLAFLMGFEAHIAGTELKFEFWEEPPHTKGSYGNGGSTPSVIIKTLNLISKEKYQGIEGGDAFIKSVLWSQTELIEFGKENAKRPDICQDEDGFLHIHTRGMYGKKVNVKIYEKDTIGDPAFLKSFNNVQIYHNIVYLPVSMNTIYSAAEKVRPIISENKCFDIFAKVIPEDTSIYSKESDVIDLWINKIADKSATKSTANGVSKAVIGEASTDEQNKKEEDSYLKRKVFYIHGTASSQERWERYADVVDVFNKIAFPAPMPIEQDTGFDWSKDAGFLNNLKTRMKVSDELVTRIVNNTEGFEEIVLIGHSHGGNVAIQAAEKLATTKKFKKIYVITVGTPVFNKDKFEIVELDTNSQIKGLTMVGEQPEKIIVQIKQNDGTMKDDTRYKYTYKNPENPASWSDATKKITKHLSLYNIYDRVDGIAEIGSAILEFGRMNSNTNTFEYNQSINKEIVSKLDDNSINHFFYQNHCSHRISILLRLRLMIAQAETPHIWAKFDNVMELQTASYAFWGYRDVGNIPDFMPAFNMASFNMQGKPKIDADKIKNMGMDNMDILFVDNKESWASFKTNFWKKCLPANEHIINYPAMGKKISPNLQKIDAEIERLLREIENTRDWDQKIEQDKLLSGWGEFAVEMLSKTPILCNLYRPIKYITDGIDNHSFDLYSPELIEQAIREGRIKPFPRTPREKEKPTKQS